MLEYIDYFYDKSDVLEDLAPYLLLLETGADVTHVRDRFRDRVAQTEHAEGEAPAILRQDGSYAFNCHIASPDDFEKRVVPLRIIRWKFV